MIRPDLLASFSNENLEILTSDGNISFLSSQYAFLIVAPALDNYRYNLFSIWHDINLYPVTINVDSDICTEIDSNDQNGELVAESENEFVEILKKIFGAKKTKKIIGAILSMISYEE